MGLTGRPLPRPGGAPASQAPGLAAITVAARVGRGGGGANTRRLGTRRLAQAAGQWARSPGRRGRHHRAPAARACWALATALCASAALSAGDEGWRGDLRPIPEAAWNPARAEHLLERAGFGGTPEDIAALTALGAEGAVRRLVHFEGAPGPGQDDLPPFDHSGIFDPSLDPFPPSRPAATAAARKAGHGLGVDVKPGGNRPLQPIVNRFFYWLRASRLETDRVAYWWGNRMLATPRPLEEKMALFWHGHFATNEDKVRDYRKMLRQLRLLQTHGLGNFEALVGKVAKDAAMLAFLDAGVNVVGSPNENFAREIMELFSMGPGHYTEADIREAARAFTGWNFAGLEFAFDPARHDAGPKAFLGHAGPFGGEDIIRLIAAREATARFISAKLYRHFVREELAPALHDALATRFRRLDLEIAPFLEMLFRSRDFHAPASVATHIKGPVQLVISTYRKLGLRELPGVPDFNVVTGALGQRLLHPPTVAGWPAGRSWVTPGLLLARGNFVLDVLFPDIAFVPPDRYPSLTPNILPVHERLRAGMDMGAATRPPGVAAAAAGMAASNLLADRDEDFNTRYGSYRGWQMALERVKPLSRHTARLDLASMVLRQGLATPREVVEHFAERFLSLPLEEAAIAALAALLADELGSDDVQGAATWLEAPLRVMLHALLCLPAYQLG